MSIRTSDVGYTSAMPRREDHKVHMDMWGIWEGRKKKERKKERKKEKSRDHVWQPYIFSMMN